MIRKEQATVYRGTTRRWFNLRGASIDCARSFLKEHYCECGETGFNQPYYVCDLHDEIEGEYVFSVLSHIIAPIFRKRYKDKNEEEVTIEEVNEAIRPNLDKYPYLEKWIL